MNAPVFDTPEDAETAFYRAFEKADLEAMMAVWADEDEIVCIHPGGKRQLGRIDVRESWRRIFAGGVKLTFRVTGHASLDRLDMRIHNVLEEISMSGTSRVVGQVFVTNVFVRTASGWRMWMHHGSNPTGDADPEPEDGPAPTLH